MKNRFFNKTRKQINGVIHPQFDKNEKNTNKQIENKSKNDLWKRSIFFQIKFHFDDWDSLYKYIDKDILPPDYGGNIAVDYKDIYEKLYQRNDQILESFMLYRTLDKQ